MSTPPFLGGRREIHITCPSCDFVSSIPPAAIGRNAYFCSSCGKAIDLKVQLIRPPSADAGLPVARKDKGTSKYKSARRGRR